METERWQQIESVFHSALDCAPEGRAGLLDLACGGNAELRAEVESLLAAYHKTGFTQNAAFADGFRLLEKSAAPRRGGRQIGPYRMLRELGSGGMGAVYLAARADEVFEKFVALKIVRRGLDTEDSVQRFRSERKILATLEHPNITRLLDGGTTDDGLPYLVMEYVEGEPIDQYCDANKFSITERLKLFQAVCTAVGYAHQNLIIHRDIKPGNVLVTREGTAKLLDFGIAKLLTLESGSGEATITMARHRYLTPEYASPEQVRGQTITTAADVYSLGVVLYRLLCGRSPYSMSACSAADMEHAICETEPEKPSRAVLRDGEPRTPDHSSGTTRHTISAARKDTPDKLRRRLEGDLDNIVLKALSKEPQRRYVSVEQFSEDINRHLANVPVMARPDTPGYRAAKFIIRHQTGVAAAALIALSLIAGVVGTSWQARVARTERAKAQEQFNDVRKLSTSFLFEFNNSIQSLPGATPARKLLTQRALEYLSKLAQQAQGDAGLQRELAEAYLKIGDLQGNPYEPNLGDSHGAAESYDKALAISSGLVQANARDGQARLYLARSYQSLGEVLPLSGNPVDGLKNLRKASEVFEELVRPEPGNRDLRKQLANCYQSLGDLQGHSGLQNLGDRVGALESYRKAIAIFDSVAAEDSNDKTARRGGAVLRIRIGDMQQGQGDLGAALENYRAALDRAESLAASDPKNDRAQRLLALSYRKMADVLNQTNEFKLALQNVFKAADINERLATADPDNAQAHMNFALSLATEAELFHKTGVRSDALVKYRQATGILEKLSAAAPADVFIRGQLSGSLIATGAVLAETGKSAEAHGYTSRGLSIAHDLANRSNATPDEMSRYALALITCQPHDLRQPAAALESAKRAVEKSESHDPNSLDVLAQAYFQNQDLTHAIESEKEALKLLPTPPPGETVSLIRQKMQGRLTSFEARQKDH